jgi:hypothetical protein
MAKKKNGPGTRNKVVRDKTPSLSRSKHITKQTAVIDCGARQDNAPSVSNHEKIALLAYSYYEQRGYLGGSPEEDWYRAEKEIELAFKVL